MEAIDIDSIVSGAAEAPQAVAAIRAALQRGDLTVLGLVALLRGPLTDDTDHDGRARAVALLAEVVAEEPQALRPGDAGAVAEFLGLKLQDWRCVVPAVPGCLALLQRHRSAALEPLPEASALQLVSRMLGVHVQGLDYKGRLACYELLHEVLTGPFAVPAVLAGTDFAQFTVVAVENEADPRCLMVALLCVQAVGHLYSRQPALAQVLHLTNSLEDLFDVGVAPYFPLMFNPPKSDVHRVTREGLLGRIIRAMACCPQFAHLGIPLLSEKMGSSLKQAKEDSLAALPVCVRSWGPAAVKPHLQAVWLMLKAELMAPASAEGLLGEQLAAKRATAAQAASALRQCVAALGPGVLDSHVLGDVAVEDLKQFLGLVSPPWAAAASAGSDAAAAGSDAAAAAAGAAADAADWQLPDKAQKRLSCIASCVAAVAAAGGASCAAACAEVLRPAVAAVLADVSGFSADSSSTAAPMRPLQADSAVLCVLHQALSAVAAAAAATQPAASEGFDSVAALVADVVTMLAQLQQLVTAVLQQRQQGPPAGPLQAHCEDIVQVKQLQLWLPLLLQDVLSLPAAATPLSQTHLDLIARQLVQLALHGSSGDSELELLPGLELSEHAAAASALAALAGWPPAADEVAASATAGSSGMQALSSHAASVLLPLLQSSTGAGGSEALALRQRASSLMQQLAGSSPAAAWQVLLWLQLVVLQQTQQGAWGELSTTVHILHSCCLPALPADLPAAESQAAAVLCSSVLQAWQGQLQAQDAAAAEAMRHSCILTACLAARCSLTDQRHLLLAACEQVTSAAASMDTDDDSSSSPACLALAVLAAARPGLLTAPSTADLLQAAAQLAVAGPPGLGSTLAAVVIAGVVNKGLQADRPQQGGGGGSSSQAGGLLQAVLPTLTAPVQQQQRALGSRLAAVGALSWLARGLAMQRHDGWQVLMAQHILPLLAVQQATDDASTVLAWAAAEFFGVLASAATLQPGSGSVSSRPAASPQQLGLQLSLHMAPRALWQQKAFTLALTAVQGAISSAADGQQQWGLWLAAAQLLSSVPAALTASGEHQALLLRCVQHLLGLWQAQQAQPLAAANGSAGSGSDSAAGGRQAGVLLQLMHSCLLRLRGALAAGGEGRAAFEQQVEQLLDVLCQCARVCSAQGGQAQQLGAAVREVSLGCLAGCVDGLPYHLLHPHKRGVLRAVAAALDDDRRSVRRAAVACKGTWEGSIASLVAAA